MPTRHRYTHSKLSAAADAAGVEHDRNGAEKTAASSIANFKDAVAALRDSTLIVAAYLYFAGFVYVHELYQKLGIDTAIVDTPLYQLAIYSFAPLKANIVWLALYLAAAAAAFTVLSAARRLSKLPQWLQVAIKPRALEIAVGVLASFGMFLLLFSFSHGFADATSAGMRAGSTLNKVAFAFHHEKVGDLDSGFLKENLEGSLRLLAENREYYFVIENAVFLNGELVTQKTFRVRKSDVATATINLANRGIQL